jgi:predicted protein tyrosine phosphatase
METMAPFKITVCGIEELGGHCEVGVSHVLSILDPEWPAPEVFGQYGEHEKLELRFHDVIEDAPGMVLPQEEHVEQLLAFGRDLLAEPRPSAHLLVHCHAGVSRSTASMSLILAQALPDRPGAAILGEVLRIRPQTWPNLRILEFGDRLLARNGELARAAFDIYRHQLERRPHLAESMIQAGRWREVEAGRQAGLRQGTTA